MTVVNEKKRLAEGRLAVTVAFLVAGFSYASWIAQVSVTKERLGLGEGQLGLALLCMAFGSIAAMPLTGHLCARWGSRRMTMLGGASICLVFPLLMIVPGLVSLMVGLIAFGACLGTFDVSMNAQAVEVETALGKPIMSSVHGCFSAGALAGAACGGFFIELGVDALAYSVGVALVLGAMLLFACPLLLRRRVAFAGANEPMLSLPSGALAWVGAVAFLAFLAEGEIGNWSTVYFYQELKVDQGFAAYGYASFALAMTIGRFLGDRIVARLGAVQVTRLSGLLAAAGLGVSLAVTSPTLALIGFACVGLGLANVAPLAFAAAGKSSVEGREGANIAAVATLGYAGMLLGPPAIGFVAEASSLKAALSLVGVAALLLVALAPRLR